MKDLITFLGPFGPFHIFIKSDATSFPGKRRIYPQYGDKAPSSDDPKDIPEGFLPVMMKFDDEQFISINGSKRLQEKSVHDFEGLDLYEGANYYFFFTEAELTEAGYNISRSPGFNYWNPEAVRWEPRGHVVENSWADHRFYVVPDGYFAVCYTLNKDGSVRSKHSGLPVFEQDDFSSAWCFRNFFGHPQYDPSQDFGLAYFFIELSLEELSNAGIDIPDDLTGFRFNPESAFFEVVEKPATPCGWDPITQSWRPICGAKDDEGPACCSGKLAFPWESSMSKLILEENNDVFTYMTQGDIGEANRNTSLMENFFSRNGGPYCDCNCFCDHCMRFHLPSKGSRHRPYKVTSNHDEESAWTCDDF